MTSLVGGYFVWVLYLCVLFCSFLLLFWVWVRFLLVCFCMAWQKITTPFLKVRNQDAKEAMLSPRSPREAVSTPESSEPQRGCVLPRTPQNAMFFPRSPRETEFSPEPPERQCSPPPRFPRRHSPLSILASDESNIFGVPWLVTASLFFFFFDSKSLILLSHSLLSVNLCPNSTLKIFNK